MAHGFSWSVSRHDTFQSCRRKYFYSYYAAQEDPEIARLKKLSALPLWAGSVVHETIEALLRERDSMPSPEEQEAIVRAAVHSEMLAAWKDSEAGSLRFRLFEHEYQVPVDQDDKRVLVGIVMRSLRNFFRSAVLAEAFAVGRAQWLTVEDLVSFEVDEVPVFLRMDLAYRDPRGRVVIVDWKTGRGEGRFNEIQLAGYALYAARQGWVSSPEEIETELAYLAVPRYVRRRVDARKLEHARSFIRRSAGTMRGLLLDPVANLARMEDFARVDRPQTCRRCNFRRLCFPRAEEVAVPSVAAAAVAP
ncbi:MAG TPA: PD-(D/E)XK nuclease family protein [Vicinamibacteria bacterium]|nr:PD-(D/E)XK nuclease family protein [Vicinamibacteria bacterium]